MLILRNHLIVPYVRHLLFNNVYNTMLCFMLIKGNKLWKKQTKPKKKLCFHLFAVWRCSKVCWWTSELSHRSLSTCLTCVWKRNTRRSPSKRVVTDFVTLIATLLSVQLQFQSYCIYVNSVCIKKKMCTVFNCKEE